MLLPSWFKIAPRVRFSKENRMQPINATTFNRRSG